MPHCEFCGTEIGYLPFKCKYCGGIFCKKHRLPENHDCTFELKHTPVVPTTSRQPRPRYQEKKVYTREQTIGGGQRRASEFRNPRELRRYLERERRARKQAQRAAERGYYGRSSGFGEAPATSYLIVTIIVMSIVALFLPFYLCVTVYTLTNWWIWTIFTSLFVSFTADLFGLFFLIFSVFIFSNIARNIELRYGSKFFMGLYLFCTSMCLLFYILIRILLAIADPINLGINAVNAYPVGFAMGGILGLVAFIIFFDPDKDMMLLCMFIPVKMRARAVLLLLVLPYLIMGLLFGLILSPIFFAVYFPPLAGVLAAYLVYYAKFKNKR